MDIEIINYAGTERIEQIAKAYKEHADDLPKISEKDRISFRSMINKQFSQLSLVRGITFDFPLTDPYKYETIDELLPDFQNNLIRVNSSGNDSQLWGPVYNLMFRAIHDWIHVKNLLDFNYADELIAFWEQIKFSKLFPSLRFDFDLYAKCLRSEIIYQAAYKEYYGEFHVPIQTIVLEDL